jgi:hypothetical protein
MTACLASELMNTLDCRALLLLSHCTHFCLYFGELDIHLAFWQVEDGQVLLRIEEALAETT